MGGDEHARVLAVGLGDRAEALDGFSAELIEPDSGRLDELRDHDIVVLGPEALTRLEPSTCANALGNGLAVIVCAQPDGLRRALPWVASGFHRVVSPRRLSMAVKAACDARRRSTPSAHAVAQRLPADCGSVELVRNLHLLRCAHHVEELQGVLGWSYQRLYRASLTGFQCPPGKVLELYVVARVAARRPLGESLDELAQVFGYGSGAGLSRVLSRARRAQRERERILSPPPEASSKGQENPTDSGKE